MSPHTVHLIAQDIRNVRAMLTAREKWARAMEPSQARIETFQQINFWRRFLADAERQIASGQASVGIGSGSE